jgi:hypothetical protein
MVRIVIGGDGDDVDVRVTEDGIGFCHQLFPWMCCTGLCKLVCVNITKGNDGAPRVRIKTGNVPGTYAKPYHGGPQVSMLIHAA